MNKEQLAEGTVAGLWKDDRKEERLRAAAETMNRRHSRHIGSGLVRGLTWLAGALTAFIFLFLVIYILAGGIPHLTAEQFSWTYNSENVSMVPALVNTLLMTTLALLIAGPLGIFSAIYLAEYARRGSRTVKVIRITAETLSGIPSIVYGLFGMLFFVTALKWGYSMMAGALTLVIMVLPLIIRTTEEALLSVPDTYREASFGLGAGKLRTVFKVVLPSAVPGILSGVILAIGRVVGETAALIYTAGTMAQIPGGLFDSGRTLAVHMYALYSEGLYMDQAAATAVILLLMVLGINWVSGRIAKRITKG